MKTNLRPGGQHRHPESESPGWTSRPPGARELATELRSPREPGSATWSRAHSSPRASSGCWTHPPLRCFFLSCPHFSCRSGGPRPGPGSGCRRTGALVLERGKTGAGSGGGGSVRRGRPAGGAERRAAGGCAGLGARDAERGRRWGPRERRERRGSSGRGRGAPRPRKEEDAERLKPKIKKKNCRVEMTAKAGSGGKGRPASPQQGPRSAYLVRSPATQCCGVAMAASSGFLSQISK